RKSADLDGHEATTLLVRRAAVPGVVEEEVNIAGLSPYLRRRAAEPPLRQAGEDSEFPAALVDPQAAAVEVIRLRGIAALAQHEIPNGIIGKQMRPAGDNGGSAGI